MASTDYNPFAGRNLQSATTDFETLMHLLKASIGSGILSMPFAFKNAGVLFGIIATLSVGLICTHTSYILVECAQKLYYRTKVSSLTFPDLGEVAFANGPEWVRPFSKPARFCAIVGLFLTYFGTCSVYTVIIGSNLKQVIEFHTEVDVDKRWYIVALLLPLILLSYIPDLKSLAIFSLFANLFMGSAIGITVYYICLDIKSPFSLPPIAPLSDIPQFFSITLFAMEAIGVIMPLENNMANPQHFLGICGVLSRGMGIVSMLYLFVGFSGYLRYGDKIEANIILNLDIHNLAPRLAKVFTAIAIFCTYGLQFFVCLEIVWNGIKDYYSNNPLFYNYVLRTFLVVITIVLAVAVPEISPFLGVMGALFFSTLGIIFPVLIEFVVAGTEDEGFGFLKWKIWKNILLLIFGFFAMIFGSLLSIKEIIELYTVHEHTGTATFNTTS